MNQEKKLTLTNRAVPQPYEPVGIRLIDQWRQVGLNVKQVSLESAAWLQAQKTGDFEVSTNAGHRRHKGPSAYRVELAPGRPALEHHFDFQSSLCSIVRRRSQARPPKYH
jgi:ABC-type transport system substrate-binding protein